MEDDMDAWLEGDDPEEDGIEIEPEPDIATSELWNCPNLLAFKCPQQWDRLSPTSSQDVRSCGICQREVHRCTTAEEFIHHGQLGHCVAIPQEVVPGALSGGWLGEPSPEMVRESELRNQQIYEWWSKVLGAQEAIDPEQARQVRELL
jgi:hypothetical protein